MSHIEHVQVSSTLLSFLSRQRSSYPVVLPVLQLIQRKLLEIEIVRGEFREKYLTVKIYSATTTKSTIFDKLFHRNGFFDRTHFSHVERQCVEVWFGFERNNFFTSSAQQRRKKNHMEKDREK